MSLIKCPECGTEIESGISSCPECGCPISNKDSDTTEDAHNNKSLYRKIIALIICIVGIFCLYYSYATINDSTYKLYKDHYEDCMEGYDSTSAMANSYSYGYFKSSYKDIANRYMDMADDDMEVIWEYRKKAIAYGASGALLVIGAIFLCCKKEA